MGNATIRQKLFISFCIKQTLRIRQVGWLHNFAISFTILSPLCVRAYFFAWLSLVRFVSVTWSYLSAACHIKLKSWNLFGLAYINICSKLAPISASQGIPSPSPVAIHREEQRTHTLLCSVLSTDIICEFLEWIPAETPPSIRQHLMRNPYTLWSILKLLSNLTLIKSFSFSNCLHCWTCGDLATLKSLIEK